MNEENNEKLNENLENMEPKQLEEKINLISEEPLITYTSVKYDKYKENKSLIYKGIVCFFISVMFKTSQIIVQKFTLELNGELTPFQLNAYFGWYLFILLSITVLLAFIGVFPIR